MSHTNRSTSVAASQQAYHHRPPSTAAAIAQARPCPVPACPTLVSSGHVACRLHWRAVPQQIRDPLIAAFRQREQDPLGAEQARDAALRLVLAAAYLHEEG